MNKLPMILLVIVVSALVVLLSSLNPPRASANDCGPHPHWVDDCSANPAELIDPTRALVGISFDGSCTPAASFILSGPVTIKRQSASDESTNFPDAFGSSMDTHDDVIDTEIVSMELTGAGGVTLRVGTPAPAIASPSKGVIVEQPDPEKALAESFFDVFFEVEVDPPGPPPPIKLYNHTALRIRAKIDRVPPAAVYVHPPCITPLPLFNNPNPGQGTIVAYLVEAEHDTRNLITVPLRFWRYGAGGAANWLGAKIQNHLAQANTIWAQANISFAKTIVSPMPDKQLLAGEVVGGPNDGNMKDPDQDMKPDPVPGIEARIACNQVIATQPGVIHVILIQDFTTNAGAVLPVGPGHLFGFTLFKPTGNNCVIIDKDANKGDKGPGGAPQSTLAHELAHALGLVDNDADAASANNLMGAKDGQGNTLTAAQQATARAKALAGKGLKVGGLAVDLDGDLGDASLEASATPGNNTGLLTGVAAAATGAFALGGAAWYARRRWTG